MSALDDFASRLANTDVLKQMLKSLREEPAYLLGNVCREYEKTSQPVPDHRLQSIGYMGEAGLRALLAAGLIKRQSGGMFSLYSYEPTAEGLQQYEKLKADDFYERKKPG